MNRTDQSLTLGSRDILHFSGMENRTRSGYVPNPTMADFIPVRVTDRIVTVLLKLMTDRSFSGRNLDGKDTYMHITEHVDDNKKWARTYCIKEVKEDTQPRLGRTLTLFR
jgi:hypothetical protein